jgi:TolA-binding protein
VRRALIFAFLCACAAAARADAGRAPDGLGETPAAPPDAPYVPALPAATPEESLGRLRTAAAAGRDDQALGEAYDYLRRYPESPVSGEVALAAAALRLRRGEYERAASELSPLAQAEGPLRSRAQHLLGAALNALGRDREILKSVPAADPASTTDRWLALAQVWRAAALDRLGRKEEAAELYRAIVASGQPSPVRAYALAAVAADWDRHGRGERARDALARAEGEARRWGLPNLQDALVLAQASILVRERKLDEAAKAYDDFAQDRPDSPLLAQALFERGRALERLGRDAEAAGAFEALLKARPDSAYAGDAHLQLGQIYGRLGRADDAVAQYKAMGKSSEAKDAGREALLLAAQVHYNAKRWRDAIPLYRRYLQNAPDDAKAKEVQGLLLVCLWQTDRADPQIAELAAALPEHPLVAQIRWELATKAYKDKNWGAAADLFKREIESDPHGPRVPDARFYRAVALHMKGDAPGAIDAYRRFALGAPRDQRASAAWMRLALLLEGAGRHVEAADAFARVTGEDAADAAYDRVAALAKARRAGPATWEKFAEGHPKHEKASQAWFTAAKLRVAAGDDDGAARDYARAAGPAEKALALYELGRLHEKHKKRAAAKKAYAALKALLPTDDPARLSGLLRLALILELEDKPKEAAPYYLDVATHAPVGGKPYATARARLDALGPQNAPAPR